MSLDVALADSLSAILKARHLAGLFLWTRPRPQARAGLPPEARPVHRATVGREPPTGSPERAAILTITRMSCNLDGV